MPGEAWGYHLKVKPVPESEHPSDLVMYFEVLLQQYVFVRRCFAMVDPRLLADQHDSNIHIYKQTIVQRRGRRMCWSNRPTEPLPSFPYPSLTCNMVRCAMPTPPVWTMCLVFGLFVVVFCLQERVLRTERRGLTWNRPRREKRSPSYTRYVPGIAHSMYST